MIEIKDLNSIPKQFVDGGIAAHNEEMFIFAITSGQQVHGFATSPKQMKAIIEMFTKNLQIYESKHGVIDISKNLIPSPLQINE